MAILSASTKGYLDKVPVNKVKEFEKDFLGLMRDQQRSILDNFKAGKIVDADMEQIKKIATDLAGRYAVDEKK